MLIFLVSINTFIFLVLSGLHFYWLLGGKWGFATSLPSNPTTRDFLFKPSIMETLVVAIGLFLFALITLGNVFDFYSGIDTRYFRWGNVVVSSVFLIRAVGDFKYVGFFKRVRETPFGKNDSRFYSPLCLIVSVIGFLIFGITIQ